MRTDDDRGGWQPEFRFAVRTRRVEETVLVEVEGELDLVSAPLPEMALHLTACEVIGKL